MRKRLRTCQPSSMMSSRGGVPPACMQQECDKRNILGLLAEVHRLHAR